jgi:peroxiredoxin Q/BCP
MLKTFLRRLFSGGKPHMLEPKTVAPDFEALDQNGKKVRLSDFKGRRFVLYFYPKADTPGCTKQGCAFRDRSKDYGTKGVEVLGVSFDSVPEIKAFADKFSFPFRLLSDPERKMGLAYKACEKATDQYARRYTYVIGADGKIEQAIDTKDPGGQASQLLAGF